MIGAGYVLVSMLLGHTSEGSDGNGHGDDGGAHESHAAYGVGGEGHGSAAASASGSAGAGGFHFPIFSPLALATLFAAIGGWGLITKAALDVSDATSLLVALPAAAVTAYLITYTGWKLVAGSKGSSQIRASALEGALAEVITPIPAGGMGEVAAMVDGQRFAGPAREVSGQAVARGAHVRVQSLVGGTLVVQIKEG